jgi:hypothetical protein
MKPLIYITILMALSLSIKSQNDITYKSNSKVFNYATIRKETIEQTIITLNSKVCFFNTDEYNVIENMNGSFYCLNSYNQVCVIYYSFNRVTIVNLTNNIILNYNLL